MLTVLLHLHSNFERLSKHAMLPSILYGSLCAYILVLCLFADYVLEGSDGTPFAGKALHIT